MSPPADGKLPRESGTARVAGSAVAGITELAIFHPVDTIAKRLMSNKAAFKMSEMNEVIFRKAADKSIGVRFMSLFPGLGYAAGYKIAQRVYKFGGQPYFRDVIDRSSAKPYFTDAFGAKWGKMVIHATAGSLTGMGEVVLLPLDVLKIKMQTNPEAFRGRGIVKLISDEGIASLYKGWGWTMGRNAPGSFALFGGSAFAKEYIFKLSDYSQATWGQNFVASIAGSVASITVAAPLDVIKTRIQNANFESKVSGATVFRDLIKNEGPSALFKGLTPKIAMTAPKLTMSFALAQTLIPMFGKYF